MLRGCREVSIATALELLSKTMIQRTSESVKCNPMTSFFQDDDAATAVEYAVMIALITAAIIFSVNALASATRDSFNSTSTAIGS